MPEILKPVFALVVVLGVVGLLLAAVRGNAGFAVASHSAPSTVAINETAPPTSSTMPPVTGTSTVTSSPSAERISRALFDGINRERRNRNQPALTWDPTLAVQAASWSGRLAQQDKLEHQDVTGGAGAIEPGLVVFGENIYRSKVGVPALSIHSAWMNSPEHRQNILQPGFDRVGVGVFCAADGSVWATQEFGGGSGSELATPLPPTATDRLVDRKRPTCN